MRIRAFALAAACQFEFVFRADDRRLFGGRVTPDGIRFSLARVHPPGVSKTVNVTATRSGR
jgi:hypothetical protein